MLQLAASGQNLFWQAPVGVGGNRDGNWSTTASNWDPVAGNPPSTAWPNLGTETANFSTVEGGTVTVIGVIQTNAIIAGSGGAFVISGGTLTFVNPAPTINVGNSGSGTLTVASAISATGLTLAKTGAGFLALSGSINVATFNIQGGSVSLSGNNLVDTAAVINAGTLTVNAADSVTTYTQNGTGTLAGSAALTATGGATLNGGTVSGGLLGDTTSTGAVLVSGTVGGGSLSITGGVLTLTGSSTNTPVNISAGASLLDSTGGLAAGANVINAGTLTVNAADSVTTYTQNGTTGTLAGSAALTATGGATLNGGTVSGSLLGDTTSTGAVLVSGTVGGGSLSITGGVLTLTGSSTNTPVNISAGASLLDSTGGLAAGANVINAGTLTVNAADSVTTYTQNGPTGTLAGSAALTATGGATLNGGTVSGSLLGNTTSTGAVAISGTVGGGSLSVTSGVLTFSGSSTSNPVNIAGGATLIDTGNLSDTAAVTNAGTLTINAAETIASLTNNNGTVNGTGPLGVTGATLFTGGTLDAPLVVNGTGGGTFNGALIAGTFNGTNTLNGATTVSGSVNGNTTSTGTVAISGTVGGGSLSITDGVLTLTGTSTNTQIDILDGAKFINKTGGLSNSAIVINDGTMTINKAETIAKLTNSGKIVVSSPVEDGSDTKFSATKIELTKGSTLRLTDSDLQLGQSADIFDGKIKGFFDANGISAKNQPNFSYGFDYIKGEVQVLPGLTNPVKSSDTIYSFNKNQTFVVGSLFEDTFRGEDNFRKTYFDQFGKKAKESTTGPTPFYIWRMDPGTGLKSSSDPAFTLLVDAIKDIQRTYSTDKNGNVIVGKKGLMIANQLSPEVHRGMVDYTEQATRSHVRAGVDSAPISQSGKTQVFASVQTSSAGSETSGTNASYNTEMYGVTTGVRYDIDNRFQIGGLLGADDGSIEGALINTDAQGLVIGTFGRYVLDETSRTTLTASLAYGAYDYDAERNSYSGKESANGIGSDALEFAMGVSTVSFEKSGFRVIPNATVRYMTGSVDSFVESGSGVGLRVDSQDIDSVLLDLGVDFEYKLNEQVTLVGNFGYVTDFENSEKSVSAKFAASGAGGRTLSVTAPGIDDEAFVLGLGAFYDINQSTRIGLTYRGEYRMNSQATNSFGIGATFGF